MIYCIGHSIISPLGEGSQANVEAVKAAIAAEQPTGQYILIKGSNSTKLYQLPELL